MEPTSGHMQVRDYNGLVSYIVHTTKSHAIIIKKSNAIKFGRERRHGTTDEAVESESGREGEPATCDGGQVRVGTRFVLSEDEVSYPPAIYC